MLDNDLMCPLCYHKGSRFYTSDTHRCYYTCDHCGLVFVSPDHHLSPEAEKARYDLHNNCPDDTGYIRFLNRLVSPLADRIAPPSDVLDFGSGPEPVMAGLLEEKGFTASVYDPFYADTPETLDKHYDAITCCEVAEHLSDPGTVMESLIGMLHPGGWLAVMTQPLPGSKDEFQKWHYKNDPTHICFYDTRTFDFIADHHSCHFEQPADDIFLLTPT